MEITSMTDLFNVKDKVALVTGSSRGIGFKLAEGLAERGALVILNGRNKETLEESAGKLTAKGYTVRYSIFDVTDPKSIQTAIAQIEKECQRIDILVNNAGIMIRKPLVDLELADWDKVITADLTSAFLVSQSVAKGMIARKSGKIINICSMQSELGRPTIAPYAASKGGLKMLTKSMTVEWAQYNIQVNGIGPGYFITDLTKALVEDPAFDVWLKGRTPAGRWGLPEELVGALIFLSSAASDYVNGHILYVDGGLLASV
jgi:gluconate 5-dehydrogenase